MRKAFPWILLAALFTSSVGAIEVHRALTVDSLVVTGEITAGSGRSTCQSSTVSNVPADGASSLSIVGMTPAAGSVLGISAYAYSGTDLTTGTITCALSLNGAALAGHDIQFVAADTIPGAKKAATVTQGEHTLAAAEYIGATCTGAGANTSDIDFIVTVCWEF